MHRGSIALALLLLLSSPIALFSDDDRQDSEYVSLEQPVREIQAIGERCPVRVEMPVPAMEVGGEQRILGVLARYVHCRGVRLSHVEFEVNRGPLDLIELSASGYVIAPKGRDSTVELVYEWRTPGGDSHSTRQYMHLDEGEINWEDAAIVRVPESLDLSNLRLRVDMTSPVE